KDAAGVARPYAIGAPAMKADVIGKRVRLFKYRARPLFPTGVIDDQVHPLMPRQVADNLGVDPRNRRELSRPVAAEMRPGKPCGLVRLPLGRHAVSPGRREKFGTRASHLSSSHF